MELVWDPDSWNDYLFWQKNDTLVVPSAAEGAQKIKGLNARRSLDSAWHDQSRINNLIKEILRDPFKGVGKPEPLKGNLAGCWSRRLNDEHRLVYFLQEGRLHILQCRFHY